MGDEQPTIVSELADRIALPDLADEMQCHKQTLFKIAKRLGITPIKRRDADKRNQLVATITREEALAVRSEVVSRTRTGTEASSEFDYVIADVGCFYIVQLEPEHDPGRIKVGFTTDMEGRLRKHRCSAPFAMSIRTWPCRRTWERAAIDSVTVGIEQLHTEIFRAKSIDEVIARAEKFFAAMPNVSTAPEDEILEEVFQSNSDGYASST